MVKECAVIGVPTSAGAHHAGQDQAPAALRAHGLVDRLRATGLEVVDVGDVAGEVFQADTLEARARNTEAVVRVARAVADAVERETRSGRVPIVLGGDCTITLGVVAGLQPAAADVRLAYVDGDADLGDPGRESSSGILDASGVAHLIGIADTPLARIGRTVPMLADHQLVLLGYDPTDPQSYDAAVLAEHPGLRHFSDADVRADPPGTARRALDALMSPDAGEDPSGRDDVRLVVHFDVDSVDSRDLPLANFPHYGTGVPLDAAGQVLSVLLADPHLSAVVLTEVNPTYDPGGAQLERYVTTVTEAFAHVS